MAATATATTAVNTTLEVRIPFSWRWLGPCQALRSDGRANRRSQLRRERIRAAPIPIPADAIDEAAVLECVQHAKHDAAREARPAHDLAEPQLLAALKHTKDVERAKNRPAQIPVVVDV